MKPFFSLHSSFLHLLTAVSLAAAFIPVPGNATTMNNPDKTCGGGSGGSGGGDGYSQCDSCGRCTDGLPQGADEDPYMSLPISNGSDDCPDNDISLYIPPSDPPPPPTRRSVSISSSNASSVNSVHASSSVMAGSAINESYGKAESFAIKNGGASSTVRSATGNISQVKGRTGFATLSAADGGGAEVVRYPAKAVSGKASDGSYTLKAGAVPNYSTKTQTMSKSGGSLPAGASYVGVNFVGKSGFSTGSLRVKSLSVEQVKQPVVDDSPVALTLVKTWKHGEGDNAAEYRRATTESIQVKNGQPNEEYFICTVEETGSNGQWYVVQRKSGRRAIYKKTEGFVPLYECNAVDAKGTPLPLISTETTYTYYTDPSDTASYGKVKTRRVNDGYWENKSYTENQSARLKTETTESPWLSTEAHEPGSSPKGSIRTKTVVTCEGDQGINDTTETVDGIVIFKEYTEKSPVAGDKIREILHQPHSGGDKITTTLRYRKIDSVPEHLREKPVSIHFADGQSEIYTYQDLGEDQYKMTCDAGYSSSSGSISEGTRTEQTFDKETGKLREEVRYALSGGSPHWLSSRTGDVSQLDANGNCLVWYYDNNSEDFTKQTRDCCNLLSNRWRDGSETVYTYTPGGKVATETSKGITITTIYEGLTTFVYRSEDGNGRRYLVEKEVKDLSGSVIQKVTPAFGDTECSVIYERDIKNRTMTSTRSVDGVKKTMIGYADNQVFKESDSSTTECVYTYSPSAENGGGIKISMVLFDKCGGSPQSEIVSVADLSEKLVSQTMTTSPGAPVIRYRYNNAGQKTAVLHPDGETDLFSYEGSVQYKGTDMDGDGVLTPARDIITCENTVFDPSWPEGTGSWKTVTKGALSGNWKTLKTIWRTDDETQVRTRLFGMERDSLDSYSSALAQKDSSYSESFTNALGIKTSNFYSKNPNGSLASFRQELTDADGQAITWNETYYDVWGNRVRSIHARTGTSTFEYDPNTHLLTRLTDPAGASTSFAYDQFGRETQCTLPNGKVRITQYNLAGHPVRQWGGEEYPVEYSYDNFGRTLKMSTFREPTSANENFPTGQEASVTEWKYDPSSGNMLIKTFPDGGRLVYTYSPGNKVKTKTNARGTTASFSHDADGKTTAIHFNDNGNTPDIVYEYDQLQRMTRSASIGVANYAYTYSPHNIHVASESVSITRKDGTTFDRTLRREYDNSSRLISLSVLHGDAVEHKVDYAYNPLGFISSISSDGKVFSYDYLAQSPQLVSRISGPVSMVSNEYEPSRDILARKTNSWKNKEGVVSSFIYETDNMGRKSRITASGAAFSSTSGQERRVSYDAFGHLTQEIFTASSLFNRNYSYDSIGNRISSSDGVPETTLYTSNASNQYTGISSSTGNTIPSYDADGNLIKGLPEGGGIEGRNALSFSHDALNRIVSVSQGNDVIEQSAYDSKGRKVVQGDRIFLYDGLLRLAEYRGGNGSLNKTYTWGADISGSFRGADGIGGLLAIKDMAGMLPVISYAVYDGLGNVTEYLNEENSGKVVAHYEYDAFGNILHQTGEKSDTYEYRFSTKCYDEKTGLYYFGYREYDPVGGRWVTRDPLQEEGGINLYAAFRNNSLLYYDSDGQFLDVLWDAANIAIGVSSLCQNVADGNWGAAATDLGGIALDTAAAAIPVVPGGAGTAIKAARAAEKAAAKAAKKAAENAAKKAAKEAEKKAANKVGKNLRDNLKNTKDPNLVPKAGEEAHHIVPKKGPGPNRKNQEEMECLRNRLKEAGVDINDPKNGVPLPKDFHRGETLSDKYYDKLLDATQGKTGDDLIQAVQDFGAELQRQAGRLP